MVPFPSLGGSQIGFALIISVVRTRPNQMFCGKDRANIIPIVIFSKRAKQTVIIKCIESVIIVTGAVVVRWSGWERHAYHPLHQHASYLHRTVKATLLTYSSCALMRACASRIP